MSKVCADILETPICMKQINCIISCALCFKKYVLTLNIFYLKFAFWPTTLDVNNCRMGAFGCLNQLDIRIEGNTKRMSNRQQK